MQKTLMIAAAALALTVGAATLHSSPAQAGGGFHLKIGVGGYGPHYYGSNYDHHGCYTKWKKVRVRVYEDYGAWHWKWIKKPIEICY